MCAQNRSVDCSGGFVRGMSMAVMQFHDASSVDSYVPFLRLAGGLHLAFRSCLEPT